MIARSSSAGCVPSSMPRRGRGLSDAVENVSRWQRNSKDEIEASIPKHDLARITVT